MNYSELNKIVLIGASTGGPGQIQKIIQALPLLKNTAVVIAQHMVVEFMPSFAKRVQEASKNSISIPKDKELFENTHIYICEGESELKKENNRLFFSHQNSSLNNYNPNIDLLFNSFDVLVNDLDILCVILTGIGDDGVAACKHLSEQGVRCLTESHSSAIVDGMPSRARDSVVSIEVDAIEDIVKKISEFCE